MYVIRSIWENGLKMMNTVSKYTLRNCVGGIYISEEDESNSNNFKVDKNFATKEDMINNNNKSVSSAFTSL